MGGTISPTGGFYTHGWSSSTQAQEWVGYMNTTHHELSGYYQDLSVNSEVFRVPKSAGSWTYGTGWPARINFSGSLAIIRQANWEGTGFTHSAGSYVTLTNCCEPGNGPGQCSGDPHIITFDGTKYTL
jgi:hypothetical protein